MGMRPGPMGKASRSAREIFAHEIEDGKSWYEGQGDEPANEELAMAIACIERLTEALAEAAQCIDDTEDRIARSRARASLIHHEATKLLDDYLY